MSKFLTQDFVDATSLQAKYLLDSLRAHTCITDLDKSKPSLQNENNMALNICIF